MNNRDKSIVKSDNIVDGYMCEEMQNITSHINKTMAHTISKYRLEALENIPIIKDLIKANEYEKAINIYKKYEMFIPINEDIFNLLNIIDLDIIVSIDDKVYIVLTKLHIKEVLNDWNYIKDNVPLIIQKYNEQSEHVASIKNELTFALALANQNLGNNETAIYIYDELLNDKNTNSKLRANIYGNKSHLENNTKYMELSADLDLSVGNIKRAINTKMVLSDKIFGFAPEKSYQLILECEELCKSDNISDIDLKSKIQYCKAIYFMNTNQNNKALDAIQKTLKTISNLYGDDINERRYSCYVIALQLANDLRNEKLSKEYEQKLSDVKITIQNEDFNQQLLAANAMQLHNYALLQELRGKNPDNFFIKYGANIISSLADDSKTFSEKLELLDEIKKDINKPEFTSDRIFLLYRSYAILFQKYNQTDKYLEYADLSLQYNPFDTDFRDRYIVNLIKSEKWSNIEIFCKKQIEIFGEFPNLMYLYAKSIYKQQKDKESLANSLFILNKFKNEVSIEHKEDCQKMIDNLIMSGTTPSCQYVNKNDKPSQLLTLENFNNKLEEFKLYIQHKGRMRFWKNENGTHKFNNSPENIAKIAFMDFFESEFGNQIEIIDEYKAGAGAIDLYIQFSPNINIIVELKMCGKGYSSNYALEGNLQLKHYYENSGGSLCYLVVFDGRKNQNKKPNDNLMQRYTYDNKKYTIVTRTIDIYPETK